MQRVSLSFLDSYEKDNNTINELCRTCLCKTDDEYVSIHSVLPWSQREACTAEQFIEQILSRELSKQQPQPQRICSKCIRKIRAISSFRNQCMDADNILNEFHKHMEQRNEDKEQLDDVQNDILFDYNEMLPDGIVYDDHRIFPDLESNMNLNNQDYDIIVEELDIITPTIDSGRPSKLNSTTAYQSEPPVTAKKTKINSDDLTNAVDKYVNQMFEEDITASLKSLEKKYKREQVDDGGLCEQCGLSFTNSNEYKKHIRSHDDKAKKTFKFQCKYCSKGFNHKQTYNIHHNSHTHEIKYQCDMCGKSLATKNGLRIHFRYHLGIKNHVCPKCGHRFVTPRELRDHVNKKHATSRAIACTYADCSETFDSFYRLDLHLRVHETAFEYRCNICGVATVSQFRLRIHKKIHTGELIRHCPICQKKLAHENALRRHIRNVHGDKTSKKKSTLSINANKSQTLEQTKILQSSSNTVGDLTN